MQGIGLEDEMKALTYSRFGSPRVVQVSDVETPVPNDNEVLVRVHATGVNTGDWRIRAAAFPGLLAIPGRLMFGIFKPRNQRLGTEFAGEIEAVGAKTSRFQVGDRVYGFSSEGRASAEYLTLDENSAIAQLPSEMNFQEGAALPFGGLCALAFLSDYGGLKAGDRVLIAGASGGVGVYAVQIAKALGAEVTAVAGTTSLQFLKELGADTIVDYSKTDVNEIEDRFDLILDAFGAMAPKSALGLLRPKGVFLPLNMSLREIGAALLNPFRTRKLKLAVNDDTAEGLARLNKLVVEEKLRAVIDTVYPFEQAQAAHEHVEGRHKKGAVVLQVLSKA